MSKLELKPGDSVMLCSVNRPAVETIVTKVTPKYVWVEADTHGCYHREHGYRKDAYHHECLNTLSEYKRRAEVVKADKELQELGIVLRGWSKHRNLAPEILAAVLTVISNSRDGVGLPHELRATPDNPQRDGAGDQ